MLTTQEEAAIIRQELKKQGITSKQVSITSRYAGYDSSIRCNIKDISISIEKVKKIARRFESYERDVSGDILQGGNTFVFVEYDYEAMRDAAVKYLGEATKIIEENKQSYSGVTVLENKKYSVTYFNEHQAYPPYIVQHSKSNFNSDQKRWAAYNPQVLAEAIAVFNAQGTL